MTGYMIADFGGDWMLAKLSNGLPVAFATVEKGWSNVLEDVLLFDERKPPMWFSHLEYDRACSSLAKCKRTATFEVRGSSVTFSEVNVDLELDDEFKRYMCL